MLVHSSLIASPRNAAFRSKAAFYELSVVLPCLNEAETLATCLDDIWTVADGHEMDLEILVVDNGSTDGSAQIAEASGARVVNVAQRGYGNALIGGISAARGRYVITIDADGSYDVNDMPRLLDQLRLGYDLVIGNRFLGGIQRRAMSVLERYLGNPILSIIGRVLFNVTLGDFHCGLRGINRQAALRWQLTEPGMEFTSELIVKAALHKARMAEVPVSLRPDGRSRSPHLRPWRDGWRHLSLMLRYYLHPPIR
ncbi:glycosyl transferase family 2 [Fibrella aestuarina BUZ 2]|uniref:Glycosyl transferase family 2 n=1 Tax=Fibrella aestuarina BUZ 2 TaxID=1166018 RepID=I0K6Z7_9BACT|nr:glycosyltransferase family 2 protein [Fibrella aestuarina]CCG99900.1 glycosyl transferase family 2 [Fibrella aestuarina BUZ 2]